MKTVAAVANPAAAGTSLPVRGHPKTPPKWPILIDIAAIRKRRNSSICNRSKFLIDSKLAVLEVQKRKKGEAGVADSQNGKHRPARIEGRAVHQSPLTVHSLSNRK